MGEYWPAVLLVTALLIAVPILQRRARRADLGFARDGELIPIGVVASRLASDEDWAKTRSAAIDSEIDRVRRPRYEQMGALEIIELASVEEREGLRAVLRSMIPDPLDLYDDLRRAGSNLTASLFRALARRDPFVAYETLVYESGKKIGALVTEGRGTFENETAIVRVAVEQLFEGLDEHERQRMLEEIAKLAQQPSLRGGVVAGGTLAAANLSGFGLYVASSTVVGALSSALGVALPFAFYTGMSTTLAVVTGPAGWMALGLYLLHRFGRANHEKVLAGVIVVANIRLRLISGRDKPLPLLQEKLAALAAYSHRLANIRARVERALSLARHPSEEVSSVLYALPERPSL